MSDEDVPAVPAAAPIDDEPPAAEPVPRWGRFVDGKSAARSLISVAAGAPGAKSLAG